MALPAGNEKSTLDHDGAITRVSPDTTLEGAGAARIDDTFGCTPHGAHGQVFETGSATVYINGKPAARQTSEVPCSGVAVLTAGVPTVLFGGPTVTKLWDGTYAVLAGGHSIAWYQLATGDQVAANRLDSCGAYTLATLLMLHLAAQGTPVDFETAYAMVLEEVNGADRLGVVSAYFQRVLDEIAEGDKDGAWDAFKDWWAQDDKGATPLYGARNILDDLDVPFTTGSGLDQATLDGLLGSGNAVGVMIQWTPGDPASLHWVTVVGHRDDPEGYVVVNSAPDPSKPNNGENVEIWTAAQLESALEHTGNIGPVGIDDLGPDVLPSGAYVAVPVGP